MQIPEPAVTPVGQDDLLPGFNQVGDYRLFVLRQDLRADWQLQGRRLTACTSPLLAHAGVAVLRFEMLLVAEIYEGVQMVDRFRDDIAATPTVTTVRTAELDIFLAPNRDAPRPAVAALDIDLRFVEKFHRPLPLGTLPVEHDKKGEWLAIPPEHA